MVARPKNLDDDGDALDIDDIESIHILTEEEAWDFFNDQVMRSLGISGADFVHNWNSGMYTPVPDTTEGRVIGGLVMLMPFARQSIA